MNANRSPVRTAFAVLWLLIGLVALVYGLISPNYWLAAGGAILLVGGILRAIAERRLKPGE